MTPLKTSVFFLLIMTIIMSFLGCQYSMNFSNASKIEKLLEEKHGIDFEIKSVSKVTDSKDVTVAYCYPKENENAVFEARLDSNSKELLSDGYPSRILELEAKELLEKKFNDNGIEATAAAKLLNIPKEATLKNVKLQQLISDYPDLLLNFKVIVRENASPEKVYSVSAEALTALYSGNEDMTLGISIWKLDTQSYEQAKGKMNSSPDVIASDIVYDTDFAMVHLEMFKGKINMDYNEFYMWF